MRRNSRRLPFIVLGFLVSAAFLGYFLWRIRGQWGEVAAAFREAHYAWLVPGVGFIALLYLFRVLRWRLFLLPIKRVRYLSLLSATCIGFMANCVLPVRVGEIIRPFVLSRREKIGLGHALATALGLERVFDLVGLSILLLVTFFILSARPGVPSEGTAEGTVGAASAGRSVPGPRLDVPGASTSPERAVQEGETKGGVEEPLGRRVGKVWKWGLVFAGMAAAGLCGFLLLAVFPRPFLKAADCCIGFFARICSARLAPFPSSLAQALRITDRPDGLALVNLCRKAAGRYRALFPRGLGGLILGFLQSVVEAMRFLKSVRNVAAAVLLSVALWMMAGLGTYVLSLGFDLPLGLVGGFFITLCIALAVALPQAPAYIGVFHAAAMLGAQVFRVPRSDAAAFAIILWVMNVVPITLAGLAFLWYEGASLQDLARASRQAAWGKGPSEEG